jgi:hypothetical protein
LNYVLSRKKHSSFDGLDDDFDDFAEASMGDLAGCWDIGEILDDTDDVQQQARAEVSEQASDQSLQFGDSGNDLRPRLERESSMHLSEVFSDAPQTPVAAAADAAAAPTRGLQSWLERKLKDQEDNENNAGHRSVNEHSLTSSFNRSHSESEGQLGGSNFTPPPVAAGYIPAKATQTVGVQGV